MRISLAVLGVGTAICIATAPLNAIASPSHHYAQAAARTGTAVATLTAGTAVASWEMNEAAGATTMVDSTNGINGNITPSDQITTGVVFDANTTGYHWVRRAPNQAPAIPARIIQVPDDDRLEATNASETYTVEIRFRTKENFGNVIQKGQATTKGGQFKIQNPQGRPSCLFNGSIRRVSTRATVPINDNNWHVLTCIRSSSRVTLMIDGVVNNFQNGSTGAINNSIPLTIGGKINCDQIEITCDYFSGDIDWVHITKGT